MRWKLRRHSPEELEEFPRPAIYGSLLSSSKTFATPDVRKKCSGKWSAKPSIFREPGVTLPGLHIWSSFMADAAFKDFGARFMARLMGYFRTRRDAVRLLSSWQLPGIPAAL